MQFNSGNKGGRRDNRADFRKNSSDSRSYDKKRNFRQSKSHSFGDDDDNERPHRNGRFGDNRHSDNRGSKPGFRGNNKWRDDDGEQTSWSNRKPRFQRHDDGEQKSWNSRKPRFQRPTDGDEDAPRKSYQPRYHNDSRGKSNFTEDDGIRLNRYIANAGVCSRRDADQYITAGVITINGKIVTELGTKVHYGDVVKFNGAPLMPERKTYILLNKPKDYVTTTDDPHAEKTVMDLLGDAIKNRVYPVGRLDRATTGLLLLTNDGDLAEHLCHPKYNKQKIYHVTLDRKMAEEDIEKMLSGIELEDGPAQADEIEYCNPEDLSEVGVVIHSGRNRIVRRMFEALKYRVRKLDRVYYAGLTKKNLPRGKWRFLTDKEISMLKRGAYE